MGRHGGRRFVSRGDLWWLDLDPSVGSAAAGRRPVLIVGREALVNYSMGRGTGTVTVVPLTSNTSTIHDFQVLLPAGTGGLTKDSKAQAEQLRTVSVQRLTERIGKVPERVSREVDEAIRIYLGL
ncbi:type II toxin-antitoxin system PemK/MazF family toxin [Demequina sp.]|uniref:type II toxin-antitoxin system PemK/MazF family toxin n=1 Tax=Demequina sp. TaxID=2050685 RepID=UPI003D11680D